MAVNNSIIYEKAGKFAVRIVKLYQNIIEVKKEYVLSKQILKSGTSIGANIAEANGAISESDFSSKISIAYKETIETKYWLDLLKETEYINKKMHISFYDDCDELAKMLFAILKKTRIKSKSINC
jgi:four helix bundle protein